MKITQSQITKGQQDAVSLFEKFAELLHNAPHSTAVNRPDEVSAARKPVLKFTG